MGLNQHGLSRVFLVFASLFALIGLMFWVRWVQMFVELLRYGNSFLGFDSCPYFLGSSFSTRLQIPRHCDSLSELTLTLRCVREKYVTAGSGNSRTTQVVCFEPYKDASTFSRDQLAGAITSALPVSFPLPKDQPSTRLADSPPIYWEIEARGKSHGANYEAYFLVPVYKAL